MDKLNWGIIGTGSIARKFATSLSSSRTGRLIGVGSRSIEKAHAFADEFSAPKRFGNYEELLTDSDVQAVYISTPHPMHKEWAIKSAEAGKHILCEKPLTMTACDAEEVIAAARKHGVFLMEAFMYRCHPQTRRLVELIRDGAIGEVRMIQATFSFNATWNPSSRLLDKSLGGGGILDVGCYVASMSRLIAGAAKGLPFADPTELKAVGHIGTTDVDEWTSAVMLFPGDIVAEVSTGVQVNQENVVRIFGSGGWIHLPSPWFCGKDEGGANIIVHRADGDERISVPEGGGLYAIEADTVADSISRGSQEPEPPAMTWDDTLGNMRTLDRWLGELGVTY